MTANLGRSLIQYRTATSRATRFSPSVRRRFRAEAVARRPFDVGDLVRWLADPGFVGLIGRVIEFVPGYAGRESCIVDASGYRTQIAVESLARYEVKP